MFHVCKSDVDAEQRQDLLELRLPRAATVLAVILSSQRFTLAPGAFSFALRCRLGLPHGLQGAGVDRAMNHKQAGCIPP